MTKAKLEQAIHKISTLQPNNGLVNILNRLIIDQGDNITEEIVVTTLNRLKANCDVVLNYLKEK